MKKYTKNKTYWKYTSLSLGIHFCQSMHSKEFIILKIVKKIKKIEDKNDDDGIKCKLPPAPSLRISRIKIKRNQRWERESSTLYKYILGAHYTIHTTLYILKSAMRERELHTLHCTNTQIRKYTNVQIHKYTNRQMYKYTSLYSVQCPRTSDERARAQHTKKYCAAPHTQYFALLSCSVHLCTAQKVSPKLQDTE